MTGSTVEFIRLGGPRPRVSKNCIRKALDSQGISGRIEQPMNEFRLSEDDIKKLFNGEKQPPPHPEESTSQFPVQKESHELPETSSGIREGSDQRPDVQAHPASPLHRLPSASTKSLAPAASTPSTNQYLPAKARYHSKRHRLVRSLTLFAATFFFSFGTLNGGTYTSRIGYWWKTDIRGQEAASPEDLHRITGGQAIDQPPFGASNPGRPSPLPTVPVTLPANRLIIPKIGVDAPVVWDADPATMLTDLQRGVSHYRGTAHPNGQSGNVFLTGHSSNYVWDTSPYNRVFANLDKLVAGDLVAVTSETNEYVYRVTDQLVVRPNETSVLESTPTPILSLMTCTPVGTNLRRLVVRGELIQVRTLTQSNRGTPLGEG